jgi:hypothetical protein
MYSDSHKYLYNLYRGLQLKFEQYLRHISMFVNFDECKYMFTSNTGTILSSDNFGIYFEKPNCISDLRCGKVGELTDCYISAYYGFVLNCEIAKHVEHIIFKCELDGSNIDYKCLPPLSNNICPGEIPVDDLVKIKSIICRYKEFYEYMAKKHKCVDKIIYDSCNPHQCYNKNCDVCCVVDVKCKKIKKKKSSSSSCSSSSSSSSSSSNSSCHKKKCKCSKKKDKCKCKCKNKKEDESKKEFMRAKNEFILSTFQKR